MAGAKMERVGALAVLEPPEELCTAIDEVVEEPTAAMLAVLGQALDRYDAAD